MQVNREKVDIGKQAELDPIYSDGELTRLSTLWDMRDRRFRRRMVSWVTFLTIVILLVTCVCVLIWSEDDDTRKWAMQSLTVLLGFAAAAIWQTKTGNDDDSLT